MKNLKQEVKKVLMQVNELSQLEIDEELEAGGQEGLDAGQWIASLKKKNYKKDTREHIRLVTKIVGPDV